MTSEKKYEIKKQELVKWLEEVLPDDVYVTLESDTFHVELRLYFYNTNVRYHGFSYSISNDLHNSSVH